MIGAIIGTLILIAYVSICYSNWVDARADGDTTGVLGHGEYCIMFGLATLAATLWMF